MSELPAVLIDLGSGFIKSGLQTDENPSCVIPTLIGTPRRTRFSDIQDVQQYVADEAIHKRHELSFSYPVDHGHVEKFEDLEVLFQYIFDVGLQVNPQDHRVLLTQPPFTSNYHRQRLVESMFETYGVLGVNLSIQGILALYASGKTSGLVVEIGEGVTQVVPVYDGFTTGTAMRRLDLGGQELTMYLQKMLSDNGYRVTARDDYEQVRRIKETLCYVALNPFQEDTRTDLEEEYHLPDGMTLRDGTTTVNLGVEKFYCPEALFDPRIIQRECQSLPNLVSQSIHAFPIETRRSIVSSIVLSGGSSLFPGFVERLEKEIKKITPPQARTSVHVQRNKDSLFGVWHGAKVFAEASLQSSAWISREAWDEEGPAVVREASVSGV